jgi:hypothetical protein
VPAHCASGASSEVDCFKLSKCLFRKQPSQCGRPSLLSARSLVYAIRMTAALPEPIRSNTRTTTATTQDRPLPAVLSRVVVV